MKAAVKSISAKMESAASSPGGLVSLFSHLHSTYFADGASSGLSDDQKTAVMNTLIINSQKADADAGISVPVTLEDAA